MVHTTIESIDSTGREVTPDTNLKRRVERAAALLEEELISIKKFPIESRWRIVHQPGSDPRVELDLTSNGAGIKEWIFDLKNWGEDAQVVRSLRTPIWAFGSALSFVLQDELDRLGRDLNGLGPITGE